MFARQPRRHIQTFLDVGQWLCVPPFRVVCPCQASNDAFLELPRSPAATLKSGPIKSKRDATGWKCDARTCAEIRAGRRRGIALPRMSQRGSGVVGMMIRCKQRL